MSDKKVTHFPKQKRETPQEESCVLFHICMDNVASFKWGIRYMGGELFFICSNCYEVLTAEQLLDVEEDNG